MRVTKNDMAKYNPVGQPSSLLQPQAENLRASASPLSIKCHVVRLDQFCRLLPFIYASAEISLDVRCSVNEVGGRIVSRSDLLESL